jgi:hypothetical protein
METFILSYWYHGHSVLWCVAPCSLVKYIEVSEKSVSYSFLEESYVENVGIGFFRNVGKKFCHITRRHIVDSRGNLKIIRLEGEMKFHKEDPQMTGATLRPGVCAPLHKLILNNMKKISLFLFFSICKMPLSLKSYKNHYI